MINVQRSLSSKVGLGFVKNESSTSGTKQVNFVEPTAVLAGDGSTIKADGSTMPGSVDQPKHVYLRIGLEPDKWIKDSGCSKHMTGNKSLFLTNKAYDE
ncbi:hypothetical protein Tco_0054940, partial [Tanacetum coccineum]